MTAARWTEPTGGEIVLCHYPDDVHPRPRPRSALILAVFDDDAPQFIVRIAYGTSQRTIASNRDEFAIQRDRIPAACTAVGLDYDTKFDLKHCHDYACRSCDLATLASAEGACGRGVF